MAGEADDGVILVVTQFFRVAGIDGPAEFHDAAERVMAELVELSDADSAVLDSAVSSDAGRDTGPRTTRPSGSSRRKVTGQLVGDDKDEAVSV